MGWETLRNGELLRAAADGGFQAVIVADKKLEHEQNLATPPIAMIVLVARSNFFDGVKGFGETLNALSARRLGQLLYVIAREGAVVKVKQPRQKNG